MAFKCSYSMFKAAEGGFRCTVENLDALGPVTLQSLHACVDISLIAMAVFFISGLIQKCLCTHPITVKASGLLVLI